jgi:hypothetical protein
MIDARTAAEHMLVEDPLRKGGSLGAPRSQWCLLSADSVCPIAGYAVQVCLLLTPISAILRYYHTIKNTATVLPYSAQDRATAISK